MQIIEIDMAYMEAKLEINLSLEKFTNTQLVSAGPYSLRI